MEKTKILRWFSIVVLVITIVTLLLSIFYSSAFISSFMFMLSLFLFSICYGLMGNDDKKNIMYILFGLGILLIIGALVYTVMRLI